MHTYTYLHTLTNFMLVDNSVYYFTGTPIPTALTLPPRPSTSKLAFIKNFATIALLVADSLVPL